MGIMYLMCGLSGAGKTTLAKELAAKSGFEYLSIDDVYKRHGYRYNDPEDTFSAWIEFFDLIHHHEMFGDNVIIDTNAPTYVKRRQFIDWFPNFDEYWLFYVIADRKLRYENNAKRDRIVPDDEMDKMEKEFESPVKSWNKGHASVYEQDWDCLRVYVNENNHFIDIPVDRPF